MSHIPKIVLNSANLYPGQLNRTGSMCNAYSPLKNLQDEETRNLGDFTTEKLNFDMQHPVDIILQDSYDGSVNMVINDGKNQPRLIGSRFSVIDDGQFKITDHSGYKDTNIYDESTFDIDTSLKTIAQKIPVITFKGFTQFGGSLPCGSYTFYFKLSDADGNESEVLAESGIVQLYIGDTADSMHMGMEDKNTNKSVTFHITNIDSGFDYVHVLYARSSSGNSQAADDTYHKIVFDYPVFNGEVMITITGQETILGISAEELYTDYADLEAVRTQTVVNNTLFFGNLVKKEHDWDALRMASWKILPSYNTKANVGQIDHEYKVFGDDEVSGGYYNPYNVYYRVGYWPDEIYRFGVVYIFEDNSLSPVFNIQGVDFSKKDKLSTTDLFQKLFNENNESVCIQWEAEPEDYYFNKEYRLNSRGVVKFPKIRNFSLSGGVLQPRPLYISFDLNNIGVTTLDSDGNITSTDQNITADEFFRKHGIKGLFFVRQTRIPTILCQGITIGLTGKEFGAIPVIKQNSQYQSQSFLDDYFINPYGKDIDVLKKNVKNRVLLAPDAELSEATFNQIFVSNKFALDKVGSTGLRDFDVNGLGSQYVDNFTPTNTQDFQRRKLTNVQEDVKTLTDGEVYFSTFAGNPDEPYKTADVNNIWNKTKPQNLTQSKSLIRGKWGPFIGVGEPEVNQSEFVYGNIYNIKNENYCDDPESATDLDFQRRCNAQEAYRAISDRTEINGIQDLRLDCYRGDCFISFFTHRVMRNFIDPELPTNHKIIDPLCWAKNYAVRCTAQEQVESDWNVYKENEGWYIDSGKQNLYNNEIVQAFEVKEPKKSESSQDYFEWDAVNQEWIDKDKNPIGYVPGASDIMPYLVQTDPDRAKQKFIQKVDPVEQEKNSGVKGALKNIFKSNRWSIRGLAAINRADVNAVALGQWITFPICSSKNIALRDVDDYNPTEEAAFNEKRSFYPLKPMTPEFPLRDSNVINHAASISVPHKKYYAMPNVPFLKQEYFTRVINSLRDSADSITNEFKIMFESAYRDYTKIYGSITKLMPLGSRILIVFQHGLGLLGVNDTMAQAKNVFEFLPQETTVISPTYGSMWKDSVIETQGYIYGLDTVAKLIWRIDANTNPQILSQLKVEKFLIDSIDISEFVNKPYVGRVNVKAHYNAFKHDVIFTYYNDILYKFQSNTYEGKTLSEWDIDCDGYLLNEDGTRSSYQGEKVVAKYNEDAGHVDTYVDIINKSIDSGEPYAFKWAAGKSWSLCFNEPVSKFTTFYDWIPLESENIDNIWFSFDREAANVLADQGFSKSLPKYTSPADSDTLFRDTKYSKYVIDNAFNEVIPITYVNVGDSLNFSISCDKLDDEYVLASGLYLKPGAEYQISLLRKSDSQSEEYIKVIDDVLINLSSDENWRFVAIRYDGVKSLDGLVSVKVTQLNENLQHSAVTDVITKKVENSDWKHDLLKANVHADIHQIEDSEMREYYCIRDLEASLKLWKHGEAGIYDNAESIKPTHWYGQQHEFNFEFIARKDAAHKIFNNLQIIANKAEPNKFEFEVVGEVYDWHKVKPVLKWIVDQVKVPTSYRKQIDENTVETYDTKLQEVYKEVLSKTYGELCKTYRDFPKVFGMLLTNKFEKLPYLKVTDACVPTMDPQIVGRKKGEKNKPDIYLTPEQQERGEAHADNTVSTCLVYDKQLNEFRVHTEQLGNDVWKYGRLRGNMQYLEDLWRVEIRPVAFKYVYLSEDELVFSRLQETRHRDKYIKIKVRYSGEDLAVIQGIRTLFDYSYA